MEKEKIYNLLAPALGLLESEDDKRKCVDAWAEVIEAGEWDRKGIMNCGIGTAIRDDCTENLICHTIHVTQACAAVYDSMHEMFETLGPCNREDLLVGAVMHDVGKLLENDFVNGKSCHGATAKYFRHPITGAYYAKIHGLNDNVVHMILTHSNSLSPEGPRAYNTPESLILKYVDEMCYKYAEIYWAV